VAGRARSCMDSGEERADELLTLARHDLRAAELLVADGESRNVAAFLAQQAMEKAVKAVLAGHGVDYPRTHDLLALLALAQAVQPDAAQFERDAERLQEYAVAVRYDISLFPDRDEAESAVGLATRALRWAEDIMS